MAEKGYTVEKADINTNGWTPIKRYNVVDHCGNIVSRSPLSWNGAWNLVFKKQTEKKGV